VAAIRARSKRWRRSAAVGGGRAPSSSSWGGNRSRLDRTEAELGPGSAGDRVAGERLRALGAAGFQERDCRRRRDGAAMIDGAVGEIEPRLGTASACRALGASRASLYRRRAPVVVGERPPRPPAPPSAAWINKPGRLVAQAPNPDSGSGRGPLTEARRTAHRAPNFTGRPSRAAKQRLRPRGGCSLNSLTKLSHST